RHNIWEIATHAAYWKYAAWRRLTAAKRGSFALDGSDWFPSPAPARAPAWRESKQLLDAEHLRLRTAIRDLSVSRLSRRPRGSQLTRAALIRGIAAHDLYHASQVQLLKRLQGRRRPV
ncbi:MAG: DinB family protein, partial [Dehalococcoidia bacterium]|nr:DinB family protein [Dehalococcoidia bacterium]